MPEKYVSLLKTLFKRTSDRIRVYGQFSPSFTSYSGVRRGFSLSPRSPFKFAVNDLLRKVFDSAANCGVKIIPGHRVGDLDYIVDVAFLDDDPGCRSYHVWHTVRSLQWQIIFPRLARRSFCTHWSCKTFGNSQQLYTFRIMHFCLREWR